MEYKFDSEILKLVWSILRKPESLPNLPSLQKLTKLLIKKGWAFNSDVEDLLYFHDNKLGNYNLEIKEFSSLFGIHWEPVFFRPKARSKSVSEFDAIRCEDVALLLILMQRIGFQTDPSFFVDQLLPGIKSKKKELLNNAELEILWYNMTKHKFGPLILKNDKDWKKLKELDSFKTSKGYKIIVRGTQDDVPDEIEIRSPKFRRQRDPVEVTCDKCGLLWRKGDPDSSAYQRKEHKRRMLYFEPQPLEEMLLEMQAKADPELVTSQSPVWKHKEMYTRASAFRREFHYDFVQWHSKNGDSDPFVNGFLLTDTSGAIVGACSFRKKSDSQPLSWKLDWIWICPKERRKGYLAARWKLFRERFGDFGLSHPVSDEMKAFLAKNGDSALLEL